MVVDVIAFATFRGHMHRAHPQSVGRGEVARIILEHGGGCGLEPVDAKDLVIGGGFGFGQEIGVFDTIDRVEEPRKAAGLKHPFGLRRAAVGVDDPPPRQHANGLSEQRVGGEPIHRDVVHLGQVGAGVDAVFAHQAGQRGAIGLPIMLAQVVGLGAVDLDRAHHPIDHTGFDQVEKPRLGRVKRLVEVEDPGGDMRKSIARHGAEVGRDAQPRKPCRVAQMVAVSKVAQLSRTDS